MANALNFKPCFKLLLLKNCWSFSSMFKNLRRQHHLRAEIWSFEKVEIEWVKFTNFLFMQHGRNCG